MKKTIIFITALVLSSCGSTEEKKKGFEYNRTQEVEKSSVKIGGTAVPVDLKNKGIGPISEMKFESTINQALVASGSAIFKQKCTACHLPNKKLIGPAMQGVFERRSPEWVMNLLLNPTEMLKQDPIAKALLKEYNNIMMLNQNLSEEEARAISEYLRSL